MHKIVFAAVGSRYHARGAAAQAVIAAIVKGGEAGRGLVVKWTARNKLKPALVANDSGFMELTRLPKCFQSSEHASGSPPDRERWTKPMLMYPRSLPGFEGYSQKKSLPEAIKH